MSGIFPSGGVDALDTDNAQVNPIVEELCQALYYRTGCNPRFDPKATNAIISELVNAVNMFGDAYDCSRLDNLKRVLIKLGGFAGLPGAVADADDVVAGIYDGVPGLATISQLLGIAPYVYTTEGSVADNDFVALAHPNGNAFKATIAALKARILEGSSAGGDIPVNGGVLFSDGGRGNRPTNVNVAGQKMLRVSVSASVGQDENTASAGFYLGNGNDVTVSFPRNIYGGADGKLFYFRRAKNNVWYRSSDGIVYDTAVNSGDVLVFGLSNGGISGTAGIGVAAVTMVPGA